MATINSNESDIGDIQIYVDDNDGEKTVIMRQGEDAIFLTGHMANVAYLKLGLIRQQVKDDS